MSEAFRKAPIEEETIESDPVIELYKKDVDRTLFDSTLKLSVEERLRSLMRLQRLQRNSGVRAGAPSTMDLESILQALARGGVEFFGSGVAVNWFRESATSPARATRVSVISRPRRVPGHGRRARTRASIAS
jgi:hypothetical protein